MRRTKAQEDWRSQFVPGFDNPEVYHGEPVPDPTEPSPEFMANPYPVPQADPYFQSEQPIFGNTETTLVGRFLTGDKSTSKKYNKYLEKRFQETFDADLMHDELSTMLMNDTLDAAYRLNDPFKELVLASLERVDWAQIASYYTYPYGSVASPEKFTLEKSIDKILEDLNEGMPAQKQPEVELPERQTPQAPAKQPVNPWEYTTTPSW